MLFSFSNAAQFLLYYSLFIVILTFMEFKLRFKRSYQRNWSAMRKKEFNFTGI